MTFHELREMVDIQQSQICTLNQEVAGLQNSNRELQGLIKAVLERLQMDPPARARRKN